MTTRAAHVMGTCLALALLASACSSGGSTSGSGSVSSAAQSAFTKASKVIPGITLSLVAEAQKEGTLNLYELGYPWSAQIDPTFESLFPFIKLNPYVGVANALIQRFQAEVSAGRPSADIVQSADAGATEQLNNEHLILKFTPPDAQVAFAGVGNLGVLKGVYYPFAKLQLCNAYNTNLVPPDQAAKLSTWNGMINPAWAGAAGIVQYGTGAGGILPYYFMANKYGASFVRQLFQTEKPLTFASIPTMVQQLGSGTLKVAFFVNDGNLYPLFKSGAPVQWACPNPGLSLYTFQFISAKAADPAAAKLWVDFLTSKYGQSLVIKSLGFAPSRSDVKDTRSVTKQPWYHPSTSIYPTNWNQVVSDEPNLQSLYSEVAG